jgi:hypothetical protein
VLSFVRLETSVSTSLRVAVGMDLSVIDCAIIDAGFSVGKRVRLFDSFPAEGSYTNVQSASVAGSLRIACGLSTANSAIFGSDLSSSGDTIFNGSLSVSLSGRLSGDHSLSGTSRVGAFSV